MKNDVSQQRAALQSGGPEGMSEAVYDWVEQFARQGHDGPAILRMFQNPFYAPAHHAYRAVGHAATAAIIDRCQRTAGREGAPTSPK